MSGLCGSVRRPPISVGEALDKHVHMPRMTAECGFIVYSKRLDVICPLWQYNISLVWLRKRSIRNVISLRMDCAQVIVRSSKAASANRNIVTKEY